MPPNICTLFLGGDNLFDLQAKELEDLIRKNDEISKDFIHVMKKKREEYV